MPRCVNTIFPVPLRVGLGGGIATPDAVAAAFSMGAAYVLTGSINQACVQADTSEAVREMLSQTEQADVAMAPAADMFEMGVKVQVLKRGTMFAMRAGKLYDLYRAHDRYDQIPQPTRVMIERDLLRMSFDQAWEQTRHFFETRDPTQIDRAEKDAKHKMALVFRAYLGQASLWAKKGEPDRRMDYQIWCGPAMGAFNAWARGSFLEACMHRCVATIGLNLLYGAAVLLRGGWLRQQGVGLPAQATIVQPLNVDQIEKLIKPSRSRRVGIAHQWKNTQTPTREVGQCYPTGASTISVRHCIYARDHLAAAWSQVVGDLFAPGSHRCRGRNRYRDRFRFRYRLRPRSSDRDAFVLY
jgi:trans-AT polyketide synthase, acyltransferase and oxidoreductase domains